MIGDALRQLDRRGVGQRAGADLGQREARMVGGVDQVAGQRQFEAAADRHAVDAGDHRLVQVAQFLQAGEAADAVVAVDRVAAGRRLEVPAGAEELVAGGPDDGDAQFGVVAERREGLAHQPRGRQVDGVGLRPVERDLEDARPRGGCVIDVGHLARPRSRTSRSSASAIQAPLPSAQTISGLMSSSSIAPALRERESRRCRAIASIAASRSAFGRPRKPSSSGNSFRPRSAASMSSRRRRQQQRRAVLQELDQHAAGAERHDRPEQRIAGDADDQFGDAAGHHALDIEAGAEPGESLPPLRARTPRRAG